MKARMVLECRKVGGGVRPAGEIVDDPDAYRLVQYGVAVPEDAECAIAAGMTLDEQKAAQLAAIKTSRGIAPEDYADFDAGKMIGYDARGAVVPGPNAEVESSVLWLPGEGDCDE
jgi:hypothetical protein